MRDIPFEILLTFPRPNYENPETQGRSLIIVNSVLAGLVFTAVVLRCYTRLYLKRWFGSDDYAIVFATLFTLGLNATVILANNKYYWDRHVWDIPIADISHVGKVAMAAKALFVCAAFFTRLSLLCFYYRLTTDTGLGKYRWTLHTATILNLFIFLAFLPLSIFQCRPISAYWTFGQGNRCIDEGSSTLAAGISNCVADLLVTVLPIPMIMKLQLPLKQRLGVCVLLSLGLIVTIAGIIRTYFIWKALIDSYDQTWYAYPLWICAAVEIDLAVLCACAPTLRPLLISLTKPIISSLTSMYDKGTGTYASRTHGVLSSNATGPTLAGNTVVSNSHADYELEKMKAQVDVQESTRPEPPKRKWSTSWKKTSDDDIEPATSPRLVIMESQSFEVKSEERKQMRASQDTYLRLDDSAQNLNNQWLGYNGQVGEKMFGHRHNVSSIHKHLTRTTGHSSSTRSSAPLTPVLPPFNDGSAAPADGNAKPSERQATTLPGEQSFFISAPSNQSTSSVRSEKSTEWPMQLATAESSPPDVRNGVERRWDIERNPFRDSAKGSSSDNEVRRASTSLGISHDPRKGSSGDLWEDIQQRKQSLSIERSNSRKEQARGVARML